jgi:hypothetical protein
MIGVSPEHPSRYRERLFAERTVDAWNEKSWFVVKIFWLGTRERGRDCRWVARQ